MRTCVACIIGSLSLTSCDCLQQIDGVVIDGSTAQPMANVEIRERMTDGTYVQNSFFTDFGGRFEFHGISGGPCGCPDVQLHFSKPGFIPVDRISSATASGDTIPLYPTKD